MARARLHLICGICGCNDMWEWEHVLEETDEGEIMTEEDVNLCCRNCATIHSINDNAKIMEAE